VNLAKRGLSLLISSTVLLMAQVSLAGERDFNLTFSGGSIYTVESNEVVRGDRDRYYFVAQEGQPISIAITSGEDNAVIELLYKRGGAWLAVPGTEAGSEIRVWYGALPSSESNQYRIDVGGTRGNTSYHLFVGTAEVSR
ncbi:MAG: hypothetical protein AB4426_30030, partial [Xenococcaceae cyanobacterium]